MGKSLAVGKTSAKGDPFADDQYAGRNDRWLTPLPLIQKLGTFDLDPCGAPGHRTAVTVWTPEEIGDGLSMPWQGRVWLNPPYGRTMEAWVRRLAIHGEGTALLFARTETALFHDLVWTAATGILFLRGRLTFLRPDGEKPVANSGAPSVLISYGRGDADRLAAAVESEALEGHFVRLR